MCGICGTAGWYSVSGRSSQGVCVMLEKDASVLVTYERACMRQVPRILGTICDVRRRGLSTSCQEKGLAWI